MRNDIEAISAEIASIPGTPQGDQLIARMISGQDPIKRLLASLEANKRARTRQQAKAPQMQQGRPPVVQEKAQQLLASGIGSLPVDNQVFQAAGGGIVAFENGGEVKRYAGNTGSYVGLEDALKQWQDARGGIFSGGDRRKVLDPETGEETTVMALKEKQYLNALKRGPSIATFAPVSGEKSLAPTIANANANNLPPVEPDAKAPVAKPDAKAPLAKPDAKAPDAKAPEADPFSVYEAYLKGNPEGDSATKKEALNIFGLEAGLNILEGDSPYALQNIGRANRAAKGYGERLAELRKDQRARAKELAEFGLTKAKMAQDKELAELQRKTQKEVASIYADARSGEGGWRENASIQKAIQGRVKQLGGDAISKQIAMLSMAPTEKTKAMVRDLETKLNNITAQAEQEVYRQYNKPGGSFVAPPSGKLVQNKDGTYTYQP